jgi:hypothetical protein
MTVIRTVLSALTPAALELPVAAVRQLEREWEAALAERTRQGEEYEKGNGQSRWSRPVINAESGRFVRETGRVTMSGKATDLPYYPGRCAAFAWAGSGSVPGEEFP